MSKMVPQRFGDIGQQPMQGVDLFVNLKAGIFHPKNNMRIKCHLQPFGFFQLSDE